MNPSQTTADGILLIDKPANCTTHDMVDFVRKKFRIKKVGHCGTLDPLATGLVILTLDRGTKIQDLLMSEDKVYEGTLELGKTTDTQDAQGKVLEEKPLPEISQLQLTSAFEKFRGDFYQIPPMVSAIKKDGIPLYKLARQGKVVERNPRLVHVYRYEIRRFALPEIDFMVECSKGFYVRTYCHDIGELLACGGCLKALRRTRSGNFKIENALTLEQMKALENLEALRPSIISLPEVSRIRRT